MLLRPSFIQDTENTSFPIYFFQTGWFGEKSWSYLGGEVLSCSRWRFCIGNEDEKKVLGLMSRDWSKVVAPKHWPSEGASVPGIYLSKYPKFKFSVLTSLLSDLPHPFSSPIDKYIINLQYTIFAATTTSKSNLWFGLVFTHICGICLLEKTNKQTNTTPQME